MGIAAGIFIVLGGLSSPAAIAYGAYEWASVGLEFKVALWEGLKLWVMGLLFFPLAGICCSIALWSE